MTLWPHGVVWECAWLVCVAHARMSEIYGSSGGCIYCRGKTDRSASAECNQVVHLSVCTWKTKMLHLLVPMCVPSGGAAFLITLILTLIATLGVAERLKRSLIELIKLF